MNTSVGLPFSVVWQLTIPQLFDLVGLRLFVVHYDQHLHQSSVNYVVVALTWLRKGHWFDVTLFVPAAATRSRGRWPRGTRPPWSLGSPPPASLWVSWSLACRGSGGARIPGGSLRPLHPRQHCNPLAWQPQCRLMLFLFWPPSKCRLGVAYLTTSKSLQRPTTYVRGGCSTRQSTHLLDFRRAAMHCRRRTAAATTMPPPPLMSSSPWRRRRQFPDLPRPLTTDLQRGSYSSSVGTAVLIKYVFFLSNFNTSASYQSARWEGSRLNSGSLFARWQIKYVHICQLRMYVRMYVANVLRSQGKTECHALDDRRWLSTVSMLIRTYLSRR